MADTLDDMGSGLMTQVGDLLAAKTNKVIEARSKRNNDLANRSR